MRKAATEPRSAPVGLRLTATLKAAADKAARDDTRSLASLIEKVLNGLPAGKSWLLEEVNTDCGAAGASPAAAPGRSTKPHPRVGVICGARSFNYRCGICASAPRHTCGLALPHRAKTVAAKPSANLQTQKAKQPICKHVPSALPRSGHCRTAGASRHLHRAAGCISHNLRESSLRPAGSSPART